VSPVSRRADRRHREEPATAPTAASARSVSRSREG